MQDVIVRYVEKLQARRDDQSIADVLALELPKMTEPAIQKLREAAADLERILCLELQQRQEEDAIEDDEQPDTMFECPTCGAEMLAWQAGDHQCVTRDTGRFAGGYRTFRDGTMREDFGADR